MRRRRPRTISALRPRGDRGACYVLCFGVQHDYVSRVQAHEIESGLEYWTGPCLYLRVMYHFTDCPILASAVIFGLSGGTQGIISGLASDSSR